MEKSIAIVVLAAGKGTRLKSSLPKPLIDCQGKKLVDYTLLSAFNFLEQENIGKYTISLVTGHKREDVESYIKAEYSDKKIGFTFQSEQLGTGHAVQCYFDQNPSAKDYDYTLILCADTPLLESHVYQVLLQARDDSDSDAVVASMSVESPTGYGRIVPAKQGFQIIEEKDADQDVAKISEVNSGVYLFKTSYILDHLYGINTNNNAGELYLTDLFCSERNVQACCFPYADQFLGVNDFVQLEKAEHILNSRKVAQLQKDGVRFRDSRSVAIDFDVEIGEGSVIEANVLLRGNTKIGENTLIEVGSIIKNSTIENQVVVKAYSYVDQAIIHTNAGIGPFTHLRPNADIGEAAKIGNFVEIKKSVLEKGVKVSHLSYVGDAEIGENTNIGCGFITCNYDGAAKHKTKIGKNSFIGSDSQMIAPIELGEGCYVASGSTINKSMPAGAFAVARGRQVTKENLAKKFVKKK